MPPGAATHFDYPSHICRDGIAALPCKPGVYLFRDRDGMPIYIGKSINIRARVLSHLRTPEEAAMLEEARSVDCERTAGEIGALLLESRLIKQWQPAYNILLRANGETFSLVPAPDTARVQVLGSHDAEFSGSLASYGLFVSRGAAQEGLRALIRRHGLCPALIGLESTTRGRACFSHQIGHCQGACIGKESHQAHRARLLRALEQMQAAVWPYAGPIGIVEESEDLQQIHIIERWAYLDTLQGRRTKFRRPARPLVDIDVYKILAKPLLGGELKVISMAPAARGKRGRSG